MTGAIVPRESRRGEARDAAGALRRLLKQIPVLQSPRGFTMIELMIVVVIIGLLAAIAVPNFQHLIKRSKEASVRANTHAIHVAIEAFAIDHNAVYPQAADDPALQALLPGGAYPPNPFTRAATAVPWNADPANPGEISITNLPGGGYMLRARGLQVILEPDIVVGD